MKAELPEAVANLIRNDRNPAAVVSRDGGVVLANAAMRSGIRAARLEAEIAGCPRNRQFLKRAVCTTSPLPGRIRLNDGGRLMVTASRLDATGRPFVLLRCDAERPARFGRLTRRLDRMNREMMRIRRRQLELRLLFDAVPGGVAVLDGAGRCVHVNAALAELLRRPAEEMRGAPLTDLVDLGGTELAGLPAEALVENAAGLEGRRSEVYLHFDDGDSAPAELSISTARLPDGPVAIAKFTDMRSPREHEAALARARYLEKARARAQAGEEAKSRFMLVMSHEMRTPLNGLMAAAEMLDADGGLDARRRQLVKVVRQSAEAALEQVNALLDLARMEVDAPEEAPDAMHAPADILQGIVLAQRAFAERKGVAISASPGAAAGMHVRGGGRLLHQAIQNLVGNALKFTEAGQVRATLDAEALEGRRVRLHVCVEDTGLGFDPSDTARLLREFETGDTSYRRPHEGAGVGLALVKRSVEALGGALEIDSTPGVGSRFAFSFEAERVDVEAPPETAPAPPAAPCGPPAPARRALVADDNPVNRFVLCEMLRREGVECREAGGGKEVIEMLAEGGVLPEIVFMDVAMSDIDGISATRRLRADPALAHLPIVGVTAFADPETRALCQAAGMTEVVVKPLRMPAVGEVLSRLRPQRPPEVAKAEAEREAAQDLEAVLGPQRAAELAGKALDRARETLATLRGRPDASASELAELAHKAGGGASVTGFLRLGEALIGLERTLRTAGRRSDYLAALETAEAALAQAEASGRAAPSSGLRAAE